MSSNKGEDKTNVQLDEAGNDEGESGYELSTGHLSEGSHWKTDLLEAWVDKTLKNYELENFHAGYHFYKFCNFLEDGLCSICGLGESNFPMLLLQIKLSCPLAMANGYLLTWKSGRKARMRIGFIICIWSGLIVTLPKTPSIWVAVSTKRDPCMSKSAQKNGIGRYMTMIG